ncbi:MAG: alpha/beta fold hydrolase [Myxococcales bacterium]|nr:alpha/beta fold hydrolase [Myxococcales bacterium]
MLHGGGQTRHAWAGTAAALAREGFQSLSVDLRGHGDSGWAPDGDYSVGAFVGDLAAAIRQFDAPPIGIGASMGGIVLLHGAASLPPGSLRALVLVDIAPKMEPDGVSRIVGFMTAHPEGFATVDAAADAVAAYLPHRPRPQDLTGLRKNLRERPDGRWVWHWDPAMLGETNMAGERDVSRLEDAARALAIPTLLVRGTQSDLLSEDGVRHFQMLVPHAEFVDVGGAGHMIVGDRNDAFTSAIMGFLGPFRP